MLLKCQKVGRLYPAKLAVVGHGTLKFRLRAPTPLTTSSSRHDFKRLTPEVERLPHPIPFAIIPHAPSIPPAELTCNSVGDVDSFKTATSHSPKDVLRYLSLICTPASLLWDPSFTTQTPPSVLDFKTFPPTPRVEKLSYSLPSTISLQNLDTDGTAADMDRKHPSSFAQLEKLGEGTYATVSQIYL